MYLSSHDVLVILGYIAAASIAGCFSLLSLIIAKENKVSEFRQQWIDELRNDIATHITAVYHLCACLRSFTRGFAPRMPTALESLDFTTTHRDTYNSLRESFNRICMRINRKEKDPQKRRANAEFLRALFAVRASFNKSDYDGCRERCVILRDKAIPVLKSEWDRVRDGEPTYRFARRGLYWAVGILMGGGIILTILFAIFSTPPSAADQTPASSNSTVIEYPTPTLKCSDDHRKSTDKCSK